MVEKNKSFDMIKSIFQVAMKTPNHIAVETSAETTTYEELYSSALKYLSLFRGVTKDDVVAIILPRSANLIKVELAVLLSSGSFLPIDVDQPKIRMQEIIKRSKPKIVLSTRSIESKFAGLDTHVVYIEDLCLSEMEEAKAFLSEMDSSLAYVIFTSGSTGAPKGVMISRRSLNQFCETWSKYFNITAQDKVTFLASPGFDTSIDEIWPTLASGATLSIPDPDSRFSPHLLKNWIDHRKVTVCDAPTAVAELLLDEAWESDSSLRTLIAGGDKLTKHPQAGLPFTFYNAYGPTEHTIVSTIEKVEPGQSGVPSIGRPIAHTDVYIVDENFNLLPDGQCGEIIISGVGLAQGYINYPGLTADRFVPNPFSLIPGARCYRSGDLGVKDKDGKIHFQGRVDTQLSVRGNRVEPVEVSNAIRRYPFIEDAFVSILENNLVAWFIPKDRTYAPSKKEIQTFISEYLPTYMIPEYFIIVSDLPINLNGKVDVNLLPPPNLHKYSPRSVVAPETEFQEKVLRIWKKHLGEFPICINDNFFDLGGHSLAAIKITSEISRVFRKNLTLKTFYENSSITLLEKSFSSWTENMIPPIRKKPEGRNPLSFQQEQVNFFQSLAPKSNAYNSQSTIRIRGKLDIDLLQKSINALIERHELLRTTYTFDGNEPVQIVVPSYTQELPIFDLSSHPDRNERREKIVQDSLMTIFDLGCLPLAKWELVKLGENEFDLILVEHHIVHDGWSLSIVFHELQEFYNSFKERRDCSLSPLEVQYKDFASWQREQIEGDYFSKQLNFWQEELKDAPMMTNLPYDFPRPKKQSFRGDIISLDLPEELTTKLKQFTKDNRFTNFEVMFSVFTFLIHRLSREKEVCIGTALANREREEIANLIGMFVNVVVIRSGIFEDASFVDFVKQLKSKIVSANMNQAYPFPRLVQKLNLPRESAINPLFQVMFSFHDSNVIDPMLGEANCFIDHLHANSSAKQDLDVVVIPRNKRNRDADAESDERISMIWEFNCDLFKKETIQRFVDQYTYIMKSVLLGFEGKLKDLPVTPQNELAHLMRFSTTHDFGVIDARTRIHENFRLRSDRAAIVEGDRTYTYSDLEARVGKIKHCLSQCPDLSGPVALVLPRGFYQIAAQIAVSDLGLPFIPLDPSLPAARIGTIVTSADVKILVGFQGTDISSSKNIAFVDAKVDADVCKTIIPLYPNDLSYIIFTSGSTGSPKGVAVEVKSLNGYVARNISSFELSIESNILVYNSPGFDTSLGEVWPGLAAGATFFVTPEDIRYSAVDLIEFITEKQITFADLPTAMVERMLPERWPSHHKLSHLLVGGEKLILRPDKNLRFVLHNEYGPTETTISATSGPVEMKQNAEGFPNIGKPISGHECYVLNENLEILPIGVQGDLYISGDALARGYVNNPALTAEKFIPNPFRFGRRMYATGDLAKWGPDGVLHFCGRRDRQVKVHGFRIELEEISSKLSDLQGVLSTHTLLEESPGQKSEIISFYTREASSGVEVADARAHLSKFLPRYMLPSKIVLLGKIPETINGKIDEKKLLNLAMEASQTQDINSVPQSEPHKKMALIWGSLLGQDNVGTNQNFFEIGGHSLILVELQRHIEKEFGVKVPLYNFFEHTTIELLCRSILEKTDPMDMKGPAESFKKNLLLKKNRMKVG